MDIGVVDVYKRQDGLRRGVADGADGQAADLVGVVGGSHRQVARAKRHAPLARHVVQGRVALEHHALGEAVVEHRAHLGKVRLLGLLFDHGGQGRCV